MIRSIAFIDFEASGLGPDSWPVEVGWAHVGQEAHSLLIQPHATWALDKWNPVAERMHGLTIEGLQADGHAVADVCDALDRELIGAHVYCDALLYDGFWLSVLYDAAVRAPKFELVDLQDLLSTISSPRDIARAEVLADTSEPHMHRAAQDVCHMMEVYRLCREGFD
jgi:hypothetical protein